MKTINRAKGIFFSSANSENAVKRYFTDLSSHEIYKHFREAANHRFFRDRIFGQGPIQFQHFAFRDDFEIDFEKALAWSRGLFRLHSETVRYLLNTESFLQASILLGEKDDALRRIDEIEHKTGFSLRGAMLRASVMSYFGMQSERQEYLSSLLTNPQIQSNRLLSLIINAFPRHDPLSSQLELHEQREEAIIRAIPRPISSFFIYTLVPYKALAKYNDNDIAQSFLSTSLYDLLSYIMDACRRIVALNETAKFPVILPFLKDSEKYYRFPGLTALLEAIEPQTSYLFPKAKIDVLDTYTEGRYEESVERYLSDTENVNDFALFLVAAKAAARIHKNPFTGLRATIAESLGNIFRKDKDFHKHAAELKGICQLFPGFAWFYGLECLVNSETSSLASNERKISSHALLAVSELNTPFRSLILPAASKIAFRNSLHEVCGTSSTNILFDAYMSNSNNLAQLGNIAPERKKIYDARSFMRQGNAAEAITLLHELLVSADPITKVEAALTYSNALFVSGQSTEALYFVLKQLSKNPKLIMILDAEKIGCAAETELSRHPSIGTAVLFSLYSRNFDDKYDSQLAYSFERVLEISECTTPVEYAKKTENQSDEYFVQFLEEVCVPQVMKSSLLFSSTTEIEEARIDLCNYMIGVAIGNREKLVQEVKDRTRRLVLKTASRQVDGSKIYADIDHSKQNVKLKAIELFQRYVTLASQDYSNESDEIEFGRIVHALAGKGYAESLHTVFLVGVQLNEKNASFLKLVKVVRDDFVFGDKGLNSYLSTRIRHGHILTTLRRAPQTEGLLTQRKTKEGNFTRNDKWIDILNPHRDIRLDTILTNCFSDFTKEFYEIIDEVSNTWLQISILDTEIEAITKRKRTALFDFSITPAESFYLQMAILNRDDFDAFWDVTIHWLWDRTDSNLRTIKERLRQDVRPRFTKLFDDLQKKVIASTNLAPPLSLVNNAIARAKEGLYSDLENVVSWFNRSENSSIQEYSFDVATSIAARVCQIRNVRVISENLSLAGRTLSPVVDILCNIFGNAVSYSKLPIDELSIDVALQCSGGNSVLSITNSCLPVYSVDEANDALEYLRETYAKEEIARDHYQKEGGTGFYKLGRILARDLGTQYNMQFSYTSTDTFVVKIQMTGLEVRDANPIN